MLTNISNEWVLINAPFSLRFKNGFMGGQIAWKEESTDDTDSGPNEPNVYSIYKSSMDGPLESAYVNVWVKAIHPYNNVEVDINNVKLLYEL